MKTAVIAYLATGAAFLAADAIWLTEMADVLYRPLLGDRLEPQFKLAPAIIFYLIYVAGVVYFAVMPALKEGRVSTAALKGAALGIVAYATYDLTNHATLRDWPLTLTLADIARGALVTAIGASAGYLAGIRFV